MGLDRNGRLHCEIVADLGFPTTSPGKVFQGAIGCVTAAKSEAIPGNAKDFFPVAGERCSPGTIEFWSHSYSSINGKYDTEDEVVNLNGYGSMQVHAGILRPASGGTSVVDGEGTFWAINNWSKDTNKDIDIGLGDNPGRHPDWTFENNAADFSTRVFEAWVM